MIKYGLTCAKAHEFEGWFSDSAAYDEQAAAGQLACPVCGSKKVEKMLMAPQVAGGRKKSAARMTEMAKAVRSELRAIRAHVEANSDYVGDRFAHEARAIHYGDADERNIYGEATAEDAQSLTDEGIEVTAIPWIDKTGDN